MENLSNYLKEQYAAQKENELSQLKNAYNKNVQALDEKAASVPAQYEAAKNETAVQNAIAKKNFNEQAAATGLNTGASGQAELARSNAYMSALTKLNRSEAEAKQALERDRLSLQTDYENALAAKAAASDAALQSALYQEMIRQQNAQYQADRNAVADAQWQKQYDEALRQYNENKQYQSDRDKIEDERWQKQFDEAIRQYNQDYAFTQQKYMDAMGGTTGSTSSGSTSSGSTSGGSGYDTHGFTEAEIKALQNNAGITVDGIWGPQTQAAYDAGYRQYSTEQIKDLQRRARIDIDGIWGPQTQAAYDAGFRPDVRTAEMLTSSAALNQAIKVGAGSYEGQLMELQRLYNNGQITEAQLRDLASAITNPSK